MTPSVTGGVGNSRIGDFGFWIGNCGEGCRLRVVGSSTGVQGFWAGMQMDM